MEHMLEAWDIYRYEDEYGLPKWENDIFDEYYSLMNNDTWHLVPGLQ
jgi:hypothetical protein